jgi:uncharacterized protein involved in high-affinity Fe2+ transport
MKFPVISLTTLLAAAIASLFAISAQAGEYPIGGLIQTHDLEIVSSYMVGIEMAQMPSGIQMGSDSVHLETDVHAAADNKYGLRMVDGFLTSTSPSYWSNKAHLTIKNRGLVTYAGKRRRALCQQRQNGWPRHLHRDPAILKSSDQWFLPPRR